MTCSVCQNWSAQSAAQASNRSRNLATGGDIFPCPSCGSRDWATSVDPDAVYRERVKAARRKRALGDALYIVCVTIAVCVIVGPLIWMFTR